MNALKNNSDLYVERGSIELANHLKINRGSHWRSKYLVSEDELDDDFFYRPMSEARKYNNIEARDVGYWGRPSIITNENLKVITYSIPLINKEGEPYGIFGVGIDSVYINEFFEDDELDKGNAYAIVVENNERGESDFKTSDITSINNIDEVLIDEYKNSKVEKERDLNNIYRVINKEDRDKITYVFKKELEVYKDTNQFSNEKWSLVVLMEADKLFNQVNEVYAFLKLVIIASTLIGILIAIISIRNITKPIRVLVEKVRQSNPREPLKLEKINISEIDDLSSAITTLRKNVADESSKLNKIINILNIPFGAFTHIKDAQSVYCTSGLFDLLGVEGLHEDDEYVDLDSFNLILEEAKKHKYENEENVYIIKKENQEDRWIKLIVQEEEIGTFGVITDVTQDILEKMKIEYDRDHDVLTDLLNRRAFRRLAVDKIEKGNIGIAAAIMWDLDNLKFVNDTYGHEYGDEYIRQAADILKTFEQDKALVARVSGDEFLVFMYGYESKSEIMDRVKEVQTTMKNTIFDFPYQHYNKIKIRASVGIAWYPEDADNYDDLVKYADFAMYKIKDTVKGSIAEFNKEEYDEKAFLINNKEDLNKLIDEQLVYYVFHPIVDARTGKVYGYELLMRSKLESLKSPYQVLAIAASESKLYEIEKLTWFKGLETIEKHYEELGDAKIFINSIPNYVLFEEDFNKLLGEYKKYFTRVVVEILENERSDPKYTLEKRKQIERCGAKIAIDDFGSGYNNEAVLLDITPDFIKVDMEIVREIHKDLNRQDIIKNLVSYAVKRGIKVVAEGIETKEELEKIVELGVDYVQGYYISKPKDYPPKIKGDLIQEIVDINKKMI